MMPMRALRRPTAPGRSASGARHQMHACMHTHLPHGDNEFARPEVREEEVQSRVAHVVRVREALHRDRSRCRFQRARCYLTVRNRIKIINFVFIT